MRDKDREALQEFSSGIRRRFPGARIWAFGSRVRGDWSDASDLDVCIVLDSLDEAADRAVIDMAWEVGFEHGLVISTVTFSSDEFREGPCSESPFVQTILREGLAA
jgi:predicted nucleotidyltransferase